jgi:hypothetical protein
MTVIQGRRTRPSQPGSLDIASQARPWEDLPNAPAEDAGAVFCLLRPAALAGCGTKYSHI